MSNENVQKGIDHANKKIEIETEQAAKVAEARSRLKDVARSLHSAGLHTPASALEDVAHVLAFEELREDSRISGKAKAKGIIVNAPSGRTAAKWLDEDLKKEQTTLDGNLIRLRDLLQPPQHGAAIEDWEAVFTLFRRILREQCMIKGKQEVLFAIPIEPE